MTQAQFDHLLILLDEWSFRITMLTIIIGAWIKAYRDD